MCFFAQRLCKQRGVNHITSLQQQIRKQLRVLTLRVIIMETDHTSSTENVESNDDSQLLNVVLPASEIQQVLETKVEVNEEEVRRTLEVIASTGRFWFDWNHLRTMLSLKLKQVLFDYPEASMSDDQQMFALGETILELVNRLDNELLTFVDGAPFTLQRICEILLAAQQIYPKLSKLALALEKNFLVTSTLTISIDSPPASLSNPDEELNSVEPEKESEAAGSVTVANGVETAEAVKDNIIAGVEEGNGDDANDDMNSDLETLEAKIEAPNPIINPNSNL